MKLRLKRSLGVSTVIANMLMISITLALAAILIAWAGTSYGTFSSTSQLFFAERGQALQERIVIENVYFNKSANSILLFVRNVGVEEIRVVAIYVNGTALTPQGTGAWLCTGPLPRTITVGGVCEFNLGWGLSWVSGSTFNLVVSSARGNRATSTSRAP
jgi:archaellum component FlaF (FlaF/FlaG flagellin family)